MGKDVTEDKRWLASCNPLWERLDLDGSRSVALPLGLAAYCTLGDSFSGLKERGNRCETGHVGRVSIKYGV